VAASHRAQSLPSVVRADRDPGEVVAAELVTLVPAARDQRLQNRLAAALTWRLLKGKGTRGETDGGTGTWATAEGNEPENAGRWETRGRRAKGKSPAGKRETGGKPAGEPEDVR
jgi:hypothetical protein